MPVQFYKQLEAIKFLREYNQWRRGSEIIAQPSPKEIGKNIDYVCNELERLLKK